MNGYHQVSLVRRILHSPIQRFLLADEVGLGKTIEAGLVLRQYFLDHAGKASALIAVPTHLVAQWREELQSRFHLEDELDESILVVALGNLASMKKFNPGMVIIDEAHQAARWAYSSTRTRERAEYDALRRLVGQASRVLLLSATPLLHNENGFLAMLHLLDPQMYRIEDQARFHTLVAGRQHIAEHFQSLQDDAAGTFLEDALDGLSQFEVNDTRLKSLIEGVRLLEHRTG